VNEVNHWKVPRPSGEDVWGYGRYGDDQLLPLSFDDMHHDTVAASAAVLALSLPDRSVIVVTSTVGDVGYFHPLQSAAKDMGLLVCNADASSMDVDRVEMFTRLLDVAAVIGVNEPLVDGILERGRDPKSFFSSVPMVIAHGRARDRLAATGVDALQFEVLGPVLALPCHYRNLHFDGRQWDIVADGGTLHVSSRGLRALPFRHFDTRVGGSVSNEVCPCGRRDPMAEIEHPAEAPDPS
jgi:hypothetical protein